MKHIAVLSLILFVACGKKADDENVRRQASACAAGDAVDMKTLNDADMREFMSNHLSVCASACDAKDAASCQSVDKQVGALCRVSPEVCASLCDPSKPGSITDAACKRKK
ncbi:MAG: hypothetical protein QM831_31785 [Kofleriaceae bacterium]